MPESIFPGIECFDFAQNSLYEIFKSEYRLTISRSHRVIGAQVANDEFARLLGVEQGGATGLESNVKMLAGANMGLMFIRTQRPCLTGSTAAKLPFPLADIGS